ncbi:MAG TPA: pentapeptide repeat-containing protein [Longimicrobium sp.]|nr:pentapeptide repeat-containing protein [Longimicrobium sp.]
MSTIAPPKNPKKFSLQWLAVRRKRKMRWGLAIGNALMIVQTIFVAPAAAEYFFGQSGRAKSRHYEAWGVISRSSGMKGDGGRGQALQDLNNDRVALRGLEIPGAIIDSLRLPRSDLKGTNLTHAMLPHSTFSGAKVTRATMVGTTFLNAAIQYADLSMSNADSAVFNGAALCHSLFIGTSLRDAQLVDVTIRGANFEGADLRGARFATTADASGANFKDANIKGIYAPMSFVRSALRGGAVWMDEEQWALKRAADEKRLRSLWRDVDNPRDGLNAHSAAACPPSRAEY